MGRNRSTWLMRQILRRIRPRRARGDDLYFGIDVRLDMVQDAFLDLCDENGLEATVITRAKDGTMRSVSISHDDNSAVQFHHSDFTKVPDTPPFEIIMERT